MKAPQNSNPVLGYVVCKDCQSPKAISKQAGKRSDFYLGRCKCGTDNRTAKTPQSIMAGFRPLEDVEAELTALASPPAKVEPKPVLAPDLPTPQQPKSVAPEPAPDSQPNGGLFVNSLCIGLGCGLGYVVGKAFSILRAA